MSDAKPRLKPQTVSRAEKPKTGVYFVRILNSTMQDNRLSFRARGVLAFVLSKPINWEHSAKKLASVSTEGEDAIKGALSELVALSYLVRRTSRDARGQMRTTLYFSEQPKAINPPSVEEEHRQGQSRHSVNRPLGKPQLGQPAPGLSPSLETTVLETKVRETKEPNHDQEIGEKDEAASLIYEAYPRKVARPAALLAIRTAFRSTAPDVLTVAVKAYAAATAEWSEADRQFIPHPAKWFADERFKDDPQAWKRKRPNTNKLESPTKEDYAKGF
jgi:hypothetical protein